MATEKQNSKKGNRTDITPETKIGRMLRHYPELVEKLISLSPTYAKLRSPLLRRTIGRVATIRQVAKAGGVNLAVLINELRKTAGLSQTDNYENNSSDSSGSDKPPDWVIEEKVAKTVDARQKINSGQHPMAEVLEGLEQLRPGQLYKLVTPFIPAPLIDMAIQRGYLAWSKTESDDKVVTYFISEK